MLQAFVPNVSSIYLDVCYKCVYLHIAYISHICLHVFYVDIAYVFAMVSSVFQMFFISVLDACFKCFICLQMYVASTAFECVQK
jgi:hypothetical protein